MWLSLLMFPPLTFFIIFVLFNLSAKHNGAELVTRRRRISQCVQVLDSKPTKHQSELNIFILVKNMSEEKLSMQLL